MDEKQIEQIQNELLKEMTEEEKAEKEIKELSDLIANNLKLSKKYTSEYMNKQYQFAYKLINKPILKKVTKTYIVVTVADINKYKILKFGYKPFICESEYDNGYSELENLKAIVEAFLRHVSGRIKPEILE